MRFGLLISLLLLLSSCFHSNSSLSDENVKMLDELERELSIKESYDKYFHDKVSIMHSVVETLRDNNEKYELNKKIAEAYSCFSKDSTIEYLARNRQIALSQRDAYKMLETDILSADAFVSSGYHLEASDIINKYSTDDIPESLLTRWYKLCYSLAGESSTYGVSDAERSYYNDLKVSCRDSLLEKLNEESFLWLRLKKEKLYEAEQIDSALFYANKMLDNVVALSHEYAIAAYEMSTIHRKLKNRDEEIKWLTISSIADVKTATKDYASLNTLAQRLFEMGDITRSFRYVADHCLPDALSFNGKLRPWQISLFFPSIQRAYDQQSASQLKRMKFMMFMLLCSLLLMFLLCLVIFMRQQVLVKTRAKLEESYLEIEKRNDDLLEANAKLKKIYDELKESDDVKQTYIALFLSMISENINTDRKYKNQILKRIRKGEEKLIVKEIEALPAIDRDIDSFYEMFDKTFVNIYPDFVDRFNELLMEGEGVQLKKDEILNPELRIFALIKLGISDPSKIASLLHYSTNTIYNYRAKIRNKAKQRADFEKQVRNL